MTLHTQLERPYKKCGFWQRGFWKHTEHQHLLSETQTYLTLREPSTENLSCDTKPETHKGDLHGTVTKMERRGHANAYFFKNSNWQTQIKISSRESIMLIKQAPASLRGPGREWFNGLFLHLHRVLSGYLSYEELLTGTHIFKRIREGWSPFSCSVSNGSVSGSASMCRPAPGSTPGAEKLHRSEPEVLTDENSHRLLWNIFPLVFFSQIKWCFPTYV